MALMSRQLHGHLLTDFTHLFTLYIYNVILDSSLKTRTFVRITVRLSQALLSRAREPSTLAQ